MADVAESLGENWGGRAALSWVGDFHATVVVSGVGVDAVASPLGNNARRSAGWLRRARTSSGWPLWLLRDEVDFVAVRNVDEPWVGRRH